MRNRKINEEKKMLWKTTIRYQNPKTNIYVSSCGLVRMPDGRLLASHDYWGPGIICGDS